MDIIKLSKRIENMEEELIWFKKYRPDCDNTIKVLEEEIKKDRETFETLTHV